MSKRPVVKNLIEALKDKKLSRSTSIRKLPLYGSKRFASFAASNARVAADREVRVLMEEGKKIHELPRAVILPNEAELREIRIAEAASAILQVEIETGEVLNEAQTTQLIASYADPGYRALVILVIELGLLLKVKLLH